MHNILLSLLKFCYNNKNLNVLRFTFLKVFFIFHAKTYILHMLTLLLVVIEACRII